MDRPSRKGITMIKLTGFEDLFMNFIVQSLLDRKVSVNHSYKYNVIFHFVEFFYSKKRCFALFYAYSAYILNTIYWIGDVQVQNTCLILRKDLGILISLFCFSRKDKQSKHHGNQSLFFVLQITQTQDLSILQD